MSPPVIPPPHDYVNNLLAGQQAQLDALARQQNAGIVDTTGRVRIREGQQPDGTLSTIYYDTSGAERVRLGQLADGDYGLNIVDPATSQQTEILPIYQQGVTTSQSTSSTSYVDLATAGPLVTATVASSGMALLTTNSYMGVTGVIAAQSGGFVGISIDGGAPTGFLDELLYFAVSSPSAGAVGIAGNQSAQVVVTSLSPGTHTFEMKYKTVGGSSVTYGNRFLQVRPI